LQQVQLDALKPAQQIFALTLQAEIALADGEPEKAEQALQHPSFERLGELPVSQQIRSQLARAQALEANN
ncbi:MAG: penicillin-binding protein activator, partial [Pseudomonas stutzeri]|nr:penicillin-binding protein activator [Stutzerimonas stutzeri]